MTITIEQIAEVAHEANRAWQRINGEIVNFPWENTTQALRDSAIDGVRGVLAGNTPEESHINWCRHKEAEGWVYGTIKDFAAKTHPCLVPYASLPPADRIKDTLFGNVVRALGGV